jgi:hypothetical protein
VSVKELYLGTDMVIITSNFTYFENAFPCHSFLTMNTCGILIFINVVEYTEFLSVYFNGFFMSTLYDLSLSQVYNNVC